VKFGPDSPRCLHIKADGSPCRVFMGLDAVSQLCAAHDPARAEEWRKRQGAGGRKSNEQRKQERRRLPAKMPPRPTTIAEAGAYATWVLWAVDVGELDARSGETSIKALRQFQLCHEKSALEDEIKKLRAELADARRERPRLA
jgi:hypothetical protein